MKKEILNKVWAAYSIGWLCYTTVKFLLGEANYFSIICLVICYILIFILICMKISDKITCYRELKKYEESFEYLKAVHTARYKLYFKGTKEDIKIYSDELERYGNAVLKVGEYYLSKNLFSKKQNQKVQEILDQTKKIITD